MAPSKGVRCDVSLGLDGDEASERGCIPERKHPVTTAITSTPTFKGLDGFSTDIAMASNVNCDFGALDG